MSSRFGPRITLDPRASRVPMARSLCRDSSGATSGSSAFKSVDRSTSMYASTSASLCDQIARRARPRPGRSRWTARTSASSRASPVATAQVASVLPSSAIVTRAVNGKVVTQVTNEAPNARPEIAFLVANGHHNVHLQNFHATENRQPYSGAAEMKLCVRYEQSRPEPTVTLRAQGECLSALVRIQRPQAARPTQRGMGPVTHAGPR